METNSPDKLNRIVAGTTIEGEIISDSNIRIDGTVKGNIKVSGRLVVGSTGKIRGEVNCENAEIEGSLNGKIQVSGLLSLKSSARLEGEILTSKLAIEPGAVFSGACEMGGKVKELTQELAEPNRANDASRAGKTA